MLKWAIVLFLLVLPIQSQIDYLSVRCVGASGAPVGTNYILMTGQVPYPICLAIGPTLKITTVNGHAQLNALAITPPGTVSTATIIQTASPTLAAYTISGKTTYLIESAFVLHLSGFDPPAPGGCNESASAIISGDFIYFCSPNLPYTENSNPWGHWVRIPVQSSW